MLDHVQRKRHHAVSNEVQQVAAADPAAPVWHVGLLEKDEKPQLGTARRNVSGDGHPANHPRETFKVPNVNTGKICIGQNVLWHLETPEDRRNGDQAAASGGVSSTGN